MTDNFIDLYNWACWKFGQFEYRLCGYTQEGDTTRCIITEPILGVNLEEGYVETTNHLKFKMWAPIEKAEIIDMMYVLDRWMNTNTRGNPHNATDMVMEALGRKKE